MKQISPQEYFDNVPADLRQGLHTGKVLPRLQRFYCGRMNLLNKCTTNCTNCQAHLANILARAKEVPDPRDFWGVLVWAIRQETADIGEEMEARDVKPETNWLGERVATNPFELFVESL